MRHLYILTICVFILLSLSCGSALKEFNLEKELSLSRAQILIFHQRTDSVYTFRAAHQQLPSKILIEDLLKISDVLTERQLKKGYRLVHRIQKHEK